MGDLYVLSFALIVASFSYTGGQSIMTTAFCAGSSEMIRGDAFQTGSYIFQTTDYPSWSTDDQCTCSVTAYKDMAVESITYNQASIEVSTYLPPSDGGGTDECGPLLVLAYQSLKIARCPTGTDQNVTQHTFHFDAGSGISFGMYNPGKESVKASVMITVNFGSVVITCGPSNAVTVAEELNCPCGAVLNDISLPLGDGTSIKTRLAVAIVAVLIFVGIIALIGGICWWRKNRAYNKGEEETPSTATSVDAGADNRAYLSSKPNLASPVYEDGLKTPGGRNTIPFMPDPTLNLSLQDNPKNGSLFKGSTDSGLYSIPTEGNLAGMPDLGAGQMYSNFGGFNAHGHQPAELQVPQAYQPPPAVHQPNPEEMYTQLNKPARLPVMQTQATPPIKYTRPGYSGSQEGLDAHRSLNTSKASLNTVGSCVSTDV